MMDGLLCMDEIVFRKGEFFKFRRVQNHPRSVHKGPRRADILIDGRRKIRFKSGFIPGFPEKDDFPDKIHDPAGGFYMALLS
jgi:hypothetical protein